MLAPVLVLGVVLGAAVAVRMQGGPPDTAAIVLSGGVGLLAIWAVVDGLRRLAGRHTYLGTGRGIDRLVGGAQVLASVGVAVGLLPNALALLNVVAGLAR